MKKALSIILTLIMALSFSISAFAEGTDGKTALTPEQQAARKTFMDGYYQQWQTLVDLRQQTDDAVNQNKQIMTQIKDAAKSTTQNNLDSIAKIKDVLQKNKDLEDQAKQLNEQRKALVSKWHDAVKAKDTAAMKNISEQIKSLSDQIESFRTQIKVNMDSVKPLKDQIKAYGDSLAKKKAVLSPLKQQEKDIHNKISQEEKDKNALWQTYKTNIQSKDYAPAQATFPKIIDAKSQILNDIKTKNTNLTDLLNAIKQQ